jgi:hypothetical protein
MRQQMNKKNACLESSVDKITMSQISLKPQTVTFAKITVAHCDFAKTHRQSKHIYI